MYFPLFLEVLCLSLFRFALPCLHSSFEIIVKRKRKLVALQLLSYRCIVIINVLWLFLTVPWVVLQYVIVVFPDHTHLLFFFLKMHFCDSVINVDLNEIQVKKMCLWKISTGFYQSFIL